MNQKKKQIIDAAQSLFIKKGFESTSIQDILKEADIARGTFYNYFSSKNECLMAILQLINDEIDHERIVLATESSKDEESVFARQIAVRFNIDKKHNIMALFSTIPLSDDKDLKSFMEKQYFQELKWVAKRLIDIHGRKIEKYALDHAIAFLGMFQHGIQLVKHTQPKVDSTDEIIQFALQRLRPMIKGQEELGKIFFYEDNFSNFSEELSKSNAELKEEIIELLVDIQKMRDNKKDNQIASFISFLIEELQDDSPRTFLLESVFISLNKAVEGTEYENIVRKASSKAWHMIEKERVYEDEDNSN